MDAPMLLVGGHENCQIHLSGARIAPAVYFLCSFSDRLEIWPLCALAFPRWGRVRHRDRIAVGRRRIICHCSQNQTPSLSEQDDGIDLEIQLATGSNIKTTRLTRAVTIIGDDHPATLRLHGQGMRCCDHAIIVHQNLVWLVDLNPALIQHRELVATEIKADNTYYQIGDVRLSIGKAEIESQASLQRQKRLLEYAADADLAQLNEAGSSADLEDENMDPENRGQSLSSGPNNRKTRGFDSTDATSGSISGNADSYPEQLTSRVTDRLTNIRDPMQVWRHRLVIAVCVIFAATAIVAAGLFIWQLAVKLS